MDEIILTITLRKAVPNREAGRELFDLVKNRLSDRPEVTITGHVTNHYGMEEPT